MLTGLGPLMYMGGFVLAIVGVWLMFVGGKRERESSTREGCGIGLAHLLINVVLFILAIARDPYILFKKEYLLLVCLGTPALAILAFAIFALVTRRVRLPAALGFCLWCACVCGGHFLVILLLSASV